MDSASAVNGGSGFCLGPEEDQRTCSACCAGPTCKRPLSCCGAFACGDTVARFNTFAREYGGEPWEHDAEPRKHDAVTRFNAFAREHDGKPRKHDAEPRKYDAEPREHDGWSRKYDTFAREYDGGSGEHASGPWEHDSRKSRSRQPASGQNGIPQGWGACEHPSERVGPVD